MDRKRAFDKADIQSGHSTLQRKKNLCYDAFALTTHCHPRDTLGL
jgi:hypothetical protein